MYIIQNEVILRTSIRLKNNAWGNSEEKGFIRAEISLGGGSDLYLSISII